MEFAAKSFSELTTQELFEIYVLRSKVFVVEQNCPYQDPDEKDPISIHVIGKNESELVAYSRIVPPTLNTKAPGIGRVVVAKEKRQNNYGRDVMNYSIKYCLQVYPNQDIVISAQAYLEKFYSEFGFVREGQNYLEDDIPHLKMALKSGK